MRLLQKCRTLVMGIGLGLLLAAPAMAQGVIQVYQPLGFAQIAAGGLASAVPLPSIPAGARMAVLCAEAQNIRFRDDGVAPTATVGLILIAGQNCVVYSGQLSAMQLIQATGGAILDVAYYR